MAKRVTVPLGATNKNSSDSKSNTGIVITLTILIVALLFFVSMMIYDSVRNQAKTSLEQEAASTSHPASIPTEKPKPVNLELSGKGRSSSDQFELSAGSYLVKYSFKNNLNYYGSFSDGTNFISKIKCDDGYVLHVSNTIAGEGAGSEYLKINATAKCFYRIEEAASGASWSMSINNN